MDSDAPSIHGMDADIEFHLDPVGTAGPRGIPKARAWFDVRLVWRGPDAIAADSIYYLIGGETARC